MLTPATRKRAFVTAPGAGIAGVAIGHMLVSGAVAWWWIAAVGGGCAFVVGTYRERRLRRRAE